jgi:probable HAF family extracellular repeat protein
VLTALASQLALGDPPAFLVDQRHQKIEGLRISLRPTNQQTSDVARRGHAANISAIEEGGTRWGSIAGWEWPRFAGDYALIDRLDSPHGTELNLFSQTKTRRPAKTEVFMEGKSLLADTVVRPHRVAATALAALFTLSACAENPLAPVSDGARESSSPSLARASARPYTFTRLDVPGATQTLPSGINADGRVVGWYVQGGVTRGFIYQDGVYTTDIMYPGAAVTQLRGVGPNGDVAGVYRNPGEPTVNFHAFIRTIEGEFVPIRHPDHTSTMAQRLLADGTVLGCIHDTDQMLTMHGMSKGKDGFSVVDMATTMNNGGTPNGHTITGLMTDMDTGKGRGYVIDDGTFTPFDVPGSDWTTAWDMNPARMIVGWFEEAGTPDVHGYLLEKWSVSDGDLTGTYTTIDFPLTPTTRAAYTDVFGINAAGDIVGKFRETATGPFHGYIATRKTD